ncbi:MAG TPA: PAS domain S-box protein [Verrucomicrobiae bacterium]|nr:PAS domain S-box protein [Verrucomicrobiae bacterium]
MLEELGVSSQQFKILLDNLPHGVALHKMVYDEKKEPVNFIRLVCNKVYDDIHSSKRPQIGKKATRLNPKIKYSSLDWIGIYGRAATAGAPEYFEAYDETHDKWYQVYAYSPKKTYFISIFMDITEEKKKNARELVERERWEQQLVISEKRYRKLYATTQDGIMARDPQGQMIDCNKAYAKMLGYSKKELRLMTAQQLMPDKWHEQREKIVKKVLQTGHSIVFEREYKRKDGSIFPASVRTWRLTDEKGKAIGIWSIVRDITEQKESQKNLLDHAGILEKIIEDRTRQLKDSERLATIGQTAGMVGHDLRNPLQAVIGELYLARIEIDSLPESELKSNLNESIKVMEEQAVYMDKIVSDLQAFVQPIRIDKQPISLIELVTAVLISVAIPENININVHMKTDFPQVKADSQLLRRVLINLITNAVQAMPDGGRLTISAEVNSQDRAVVTVEDTGVGIPEKIKSQVFAPLFTTKPRGQGFGLAVCKRVIEAHGGSIDFESQEGKGAKFTIQFPVS